ncbi:Nucleoplasmin-like domain-containing protein [Entamoeba marina]
MFWNIVLKPSQTVPVKVESVLHLTNACLVPKVKTELKQKNTLSVIPEGQTEQVQLLSLIPNVCEQAPLDIVIGGGDEISLVNSGMHYIHVSGYLIKAPEPEEEELPEVGFYQEETEDKPIKQPNNEMKRQTNV